MDPSRMNRRKALITLAGLALGIAACSTPAVTQVVKTVTETAFTPTVIPPTATIQPSDTPALTSTVTPTPTPTPVVLPETAIKAGDRIFDIQKGSLVEIDAKTGQTAKVELSKELLQGQELDHVEQFVDLKSDKRTVLVVKPTEKDKKPLLRIAQLNKEGKWVAYEKQVGSISRNGLTYLSASELSSEEVARISQGEPLKDSEGNLYPDGYIATITNGGVRHAIVVGKIVKLLKTSDADLKRGIALIPSLAVAFRMPTGDIQMYAERVEPSNQASFIEYYLASTINLSPIQLASSKNEPVSLSTIANSRLKTLKNKVVTGDMVTRAIWDNNGFVGQRMALVFPERITENSIDIGAEQMRFIDSMRDGEVNPIVSSASTLMNTLSIVGDSWLKMFDN